MIQSIHDPMDNVIWLITGEKEHTQARIDAAGDFRYVFIWKERICIDDPGNTIRVPIEVMKEVIRRASLT